MIREVTGDLLSCGADIICHQTNFSGSMGGGVAAAIWGKMLSDDDRMKYAELCKLCGDRLLGKVQYLDRHKGPIVANCFSQNAFSSSGTLTNYPMLERCLTRVKIFASGTGYTIAMPGYMGCGIAGGNWNQVYEIVKKLFATSDVDMLIVYLPKRDAD